jgi:PhzF family phenazine biosynthesis protein
MVGKDKLGPHPAPAEAPRSVVRRGGRPSPRPVASGNGQEAALAQQIFQVDAFTDRPYGGNPAAVCILEHGASEAWLAAVAREMNLSETAFLHPEGTGWRLRWFTPATEVDLCGHATLAAAHILWETGTVHDETVRFLTRSGNLAATREGDAIRMDFPADPAAPARPPAGLLEALGVRDTTAVARGHADYLVELPAASAVRALRPDMLRLAAIETRGAIVTARGDDGAHDFVSRWFGPRIGVPEDPVTGSAHCTLGPWWAARLGRNSLLGYQASSRGGSVGVRVRGDRVELLGRAVTVLQGKLLHGGGPPPWQGPDGPDRRAANGG